MSRVGINQAPGHAISISAVVNAPAVGRYLPTYLPKHVRWPARVCVHDGLGRCIPTCQELLDASGAAGQAVLGSTGTASMQ